MRQIGDLRGVHHCRMDFLDLLLRLAGIGLRTGSFLENQREGLKERRQ
jgi:hypothetical protein